MNLGQIAEDRNPWWRDPAERRWKRFVPRELERNLLERLCRAGDRRANVVIGPRQVGKTVLLRQVAEGLLDAGWPAQNITYFDFSDDRLTEAFTPRDVMKIETVGILEDKPRVFLFDEIGRYRSWHDWLKQAVDEIAKGERFLLTDSAATLLREGGRESGQGRWDEHILEPLSFREFLELQKLDPGEALRMVPNPFELYLARSGFPEHLQGDDPQEIRERLRNDIVDRAILRDLLRSGADVERVKLLFVHLMEDSGAIFSSEQRAKDLGEGKPVDGRTIRSWISLLTDTLLVHPLPCYQGRRANAAPRLRAKPKIYPADHGLVTAFSSSPSPLQDEDARSKIFEAMVFRHLREVARKRNAKLSYYRKDNSLEIDFVMEEAQGSFLLEVTAASTAKGKLGKLRQVGREMGTRNLVLVHGGSVDESKDDVRCVPIQRFLLDPSGVLEMQEGKP